MVFERIDLGLTIALIAALDICLERHLNFSYRWAVFLSKVWNSLLFRATLLLAAISYFAALGFQSISKLRYVSIYSLVGLCPLSDAQSYYVAAHRLLQNGSLTDYAAVKPLFPMFLAALLASFGDNFSLLNFVLTAQFVLTTAVLLLCMWEAYGFFACLWTAPFLLWFFLSNLAGTLMTEHLGLAFGSMSLALFILCDLWDKKSMLLASAAVFTLALGLLARSGALLILPFMIFSAGFLFKDWKLQRSRVYAYTLLPILLAWALVHGAVFFLTENKISPGWNFAQEMYGLAHGGEGASLVFQEHPELLSMPTAQVSSQIVNYTLREISANPLLFLHGLLRSLRLFWLEGAIGWFMPGDLNIVFLLLSIALGLWCCLISRQRFINRLQLINGLAIILSSCVLMGGTHRTRVLAASIPYLAMFGVIALAQARETLGQRFSAMPIKSRLVQVKGLSFCSFSMTILIITTCLLGGIWGQISPRHITSPASVQCNSDEKLLAMEVHLNNYINGQLEQSSEPEASRWAIIQRIYDETFSRQYIPPFLRLNDALVCGWDYLSKSFVIVAVPVERKPPSEGVIYLCAKQTETSVLQMSKLANSAQTEQ